MKKSRIRETKHLSTDADSSTDTKKILLVRQYSLKIKLVFARRFYTLYKQRYSNLRPLASISFSQGLRKFKKFGHWTSGNGGTKTFKWSEQRKKKSVKIFFCRVNFRPFLSKKVHFWDHFFPFLFPKDLESLKMLNIQLCEMGGKRRLTTFNGMSKVNQFF